MSNFEAALTGLCSKEAADAHGDPERMGVMIERLAASLGFTVAMAARGNGKAIDEMLEGATGYAHREAVEKAPFARFMSEMKRQRPV